MLSFGSIKTHFMNCREEAVYNRGMTVIYELENCCR